MQNLLRFAYPLTIQKDEQSLDIEEYTSDFSLYDNLACENCPNRDNCTNKEVFKVKVGNNSCGAINLSTYFSRLFGPNIPFKNCDYLLLRDDKIAFCEFTCSRIEYINKSHENGIGKRAKAYKQILSTFEAFVNSGAPITPIYNAAQREGVFAYKESVDPNNETIVGANISKFLKTPSSEASILKTWHSFHDKYLERDIKVEIIEVKYPAQYKW